jgi:hypothetical protein
MYFSNSYTMNVRRKFEKSGPLWVPKYFVDPLQPGDRYKRFRRRQFAIGFTESQNVPKSNTSSSVTTLSASLPNNPAAGDVVVVAIFSGLTSAITVSAVHDGAGTPNSYTITPNSPSTFLSGAGQIWLAYFIATATANKTITVQISSTANTYSFLVEDFTVTGGTATFDKDVANETPSSGGTTINLPSITPTNSGSLLYASGCPASTITEPTAGVVQGGWTGSQAGLVAGNSGSNFGAEYQLSGSGATPVNFTMSSSGGWSAMAMAFYLISSTPINETLSDNANNDNW